MNRLVFSIGNLRRSTIKCSCLQSRRLQAEAIATQTSSIFDKGRGEIPGSRGPSEDLGKESRGTAIDNPLQHFRLENLLPQGCTNHTHGKLQERFNEWWRSLVIVQ